ncbi:MAG: hypothetical protein KDE27_25355 [Planctomycetes bacterium]|nr:hypothetical protein [Planctomycetota bacterium]
MPDAIAFGTVRWLVLVLKWQLGIGIVLVLLPLRAFPWATMHSLLGGLFTDLCWWEAMFVTAGAYAAAWSLMFIASLLAMDSKSRCDLSRFAYPVDSRVPPGHAPRWAQRFFRIPFGGAQVVVMHAITAPTWLALVLTSPSPLPTLGGVAAGLLLGDLVRATISLPALLSVDRPTFAWHDLGARLLHGALAWIEPLRALVRRARIALARPFRWFAADLVVEPTTPEWHGRSLLHSHHFFAITASIGLAALLVTLGAMFEPPTAAEIPAAMLLYVLLTFVIWCFGALDFYLGRRGIPVLLVLLVAVSIENQTGSGSHEYEVQATPQGQLPSPVEAVRQRHSGDNLVVVCAAGGGIFAAGWTTTTLQQLVAARPRLANEICAVSGVSGGAVGFAFLVDELHRGSTDLATVAWRARQSSLSAVTWGLVYSDLVRAATFGLSSGLYAKDRGAYLDRKWQAIARSRPSAAAIPSPSDTVTPTLRELADSIRAGTIPVPILNATAMETGRRVMIAPIRFAAPAPSTAGLPAPRADTLSEYLAGARGVDLPFYDVSLWTAARLSATFPYVTPAAQSNLYAGNPTRHHMIDGGYVDNYGVASALDFLEPVMAAREADLRARADGAPNTTDELAFTRVAIVQLRAFPVADPHVTAPASGTLAAVLGPLIGVTAIRDGQAVARNEVELRSFTERWGRVFGDEVRIRSFVLEPPGDDVDGPLSWHLTDADQHKLDGCWTDFDPRLPIEQRSELTQAWCELADFLEGR